MTKAYTNYSNEIVKRLIDEFGYSEYGAQIVAKKLLPSVPEVKSAFFSWWQTGMIDNELEVEGYSVIRLLSEHDMTPIGAFLTLDWLFRDPSAAINSLEKGHDIIVG